MKAPLHSDDPLLQALIEDAKDLPQAAAVQARSGRRVRRSVLRATAVFVLLAAGAWFSKHMAPGHSGNEIALSGTNATRPKAPPGNAYVRAFPADAPAPDGSKEPSVTQEEKKILDDLGDAPLLIVRNDAGRLSRIYVLENAR